MKDTHHQLPSSFPTQRRVRWLRSPQLRPELLRIYLENLLLDFSLRYPRRSQRFKSSGRLYAYQYPRRTPQTRGTDTPLLWLPPPRLVRVPRTPPATRQTGTRTTCVRYGDGRCPDSVSHPPPTELLRVPQTVQSRLGSIP